MKPKLLTEKEWNYLRFRFKSLNYNNWRYLDGLKKLGLLRNNIDLTQFKTFGNKFSPQYPKDIYLYNLKQKYILPNGLLLDLKSLCNRENEVGGTISYNGKIEYKLLFNGNANKINLNLERDTDTLFHTHPFTGNNYEPPSILDIVSYLANIVTHISTIISDLNNKVEHPLDDPLVVQNSIVFSKEGVYVYYISYPLIRKIVEKLIEISKSNSNYIYEVEKLLEEIELSYTYHLFPYNQYYKDKDFLNEYIDELKRYRIIMKFFPYGNNPESYILN